MWPFSPYREPAPKPSPEPIVEPDPFPAQKYLLERKHHCELPSKMEIIELNIRDGDLCICRECKKRWRRTSYSMIEPRWVCET